MVGFTGRVFCIGVAFSLWNRVYGGLGCFLGFWVRLVVGNKVFVG